MRARLISNGRRTLLLLSVVALAVVLALGALLYAVTANHDRAATNTDDLGQLVRKVQDLERLDRDALRGATFRLCARGNLTRAAIHAAYQAEQPPADPALLAREPVLKFLLAAAETSRTKNLAIVRRNLPILDCSPNLLGESAEPISARRQAAYVDSYLTQKLDPTP